VKKLQSKRKTKGLSPILGTLIIFVVALGSFGFMLYLFAQSIINIITTRVNVNAQALILVNSSSGKAYLQYTLINNNNFQVFINHINIDNQTFVNVNIELKPNETSENIIELPTTTSFQLGNQYTVAFVGYTAFGIPFSVSTTALAVNATNMMS